VSRGSPADRPLARGRNS